MIATPAEKVRKVAERMKLFAKDEQGASAQLLRKWAREIEQAVKDEQK